MERAGEYSIRGRGARENPSNRFEKAYFEWDDSVPPDERPNPKTLFLDDASESIISYNSSPDIPFEASLNPYRGCEHGCAYCYARPTHEYLGFSAGLDFESKIMVKRQASELLRKELSSKKWKPQWIAMSGVTDPYQPIERELKLTRGCLEVLNEFRNPVGIVTKNRLVARDADILREMASRSLCEVNLSVTSLDPNLAGSMEPRTSRPEARIEAMGTLANAGVPVGVMVAPIIPGLNEHEIPAILEAAAQAGARYASYVTLRLPLGVEDLFFDWLRRNYPTKADRVESRLREMRGGKLSSSNFGDRMKGQGIFAEQIRTLFRVRAKRLGLNQGERALDTSQFRRPGGTQLEMGF